MAVSIEVRGDEIVSATEWEALRIREAIGEPDTLSVDALAFVAGDAAMTASVVSLFSGTDHLLYGVVRRDTEILFSGLVRTRSGAKPAKGAIKWGVSGTGWEFLAPKRKVGVPDGGDFLIQEDGDEDRLPTAVAIDPSAIGQPTPGSIQALWSAYWIFPQIDLETYVFDILPDGVSVDEITWSGSDLDGAMNDLMASGSAAALWFTANDSPDPQSEYAPNLALHVLVAVMPDEGDEGDDLLAGFPSADAPTMVAPFYIDNDNPDWIGPSDDATPFTGESIMATHTEFTWDGGERDGGVYVRGATGYSEEVLPGIPPALPYQVGPVVEGGTGWVGATGGSIYGERYLDAPAAITPAQRDAYGFAWLGSHSIPQVTGTIKVVGHDHWHKGQAVRVTDADWGFAGRWFLIRAVELLQHDPLGLANEYTLTVGDTLGARIGFELRQQRLREEREEIRPATRFVMYVGDLLLDPGETAPITGQLANDAGKAMAVKGVPAQWFLMVNGSNLTDPEDTGSPFYLSDLVEVTDEAGQITATLHAGAGATLADAASPFAKIAGGA